MDKQHLSPEQIATEALLNQRAKDIIIQSPESISLSLRLDLKRFLDKLLAQNKISKEDYHQGLYDLKLESYIANSDLDIPNPLES